MSIHFVHWSHAVERGRVLWGSDRPPFFQSVSFHSTIQAVRPRRIQWGQLTSPPTQNIKDENRPPRAVPGRVTVCQTPVLLGHLHYRRHTGPAGLACDLNQQNAKLDHIRRFLNPESDPMSLSLADGCSRIMRQAAILAFSQYSQTFLTFFTDDANFRVSSVT